MSQYHPNSPSSAGGRAWWPGTGSIVGGIQSLATHPADESPGTPPSPADESTGTPPSPADESTGTPPPPADESTGTPPPPADESPGTPPPPADESSGTPPPPADESTGNIGGGTQHTPGWEPPYPDSLDDDILLGIRERPVSQNGPSSPVDNPTCYQWQTSLPTTSSAPDSPRIPWLGASLLSPDDVVIPSDDDERTLLKDALNLKPEDDALNRESRKKPRFKRTAKKFTPPTPASTVDFTGLIDFTDEEQESGDEWLPPKKKKGFHYYPVPQGLPPTGYFPDGPVASLGGSAPKKGKSREESDSNTDSNTDCSESSEKKRKKRKKKVKELKSEHEYSSNLTNALKILDENVKKTDKNEKKKLKLSHKLFSSGKRKRHSERHSESDPENVSDPMGTNSDHEDSPPVSGGKYKYKRNYARDAPKVYQVMVEKQPGKDLSHNKRHYCVFCQCSDFTNFAKHLYDVHKDEEEVKQLKMYPAKSKERDNRIAQIRIRGNHMINMATIKAQEGMFVPLKRTGPKSEWILADYAPCPYCNVWVTQHLLWKHQPNCVAKNDKRTQLPYVNERELSLEADIVAGRVSTDASKELKKEVFPNMKNDIITRVARGDPLICCLGNLSMKRNIGNKAMRRHHVSSTMRLSARCLIELRDIQETEEMKKNLTWYDALVPDQYDNIVSAVFAVCRESVIEGMEEYMDEVDEDDLEAPSNAIKLTYDIARLCSSKSTKAIDNKVAGETDRKLTKRFMEKFQYNWSTDVKKRARHVLRERKLNETIQLPDPKDIATLAQFMQKKLAAAKKPVDYEDFKEMQHAVLARLIAFNRRRPGELQVLRCVCYSNEMMKHLEYHVNCHILSPLMYQLKVVLNYL